MHAYNERYVGGQIPVFYILVSFDPVFLFPQWGTGQGKLKPIKILRSGFD